MGDFKSVRISEIMNESNKRLCLLALRPLGKCYKCNQFEKCESRIISEEGKRFNELTEKARQLEKQAEEIRKEIKLI
jgi:hypothetical protein